MKRLQVFVLIAVATFVLSACGDKAQTIGVSNSKHADTVAWDITSSDPYVASGWTAGDRASWEDHLRRRTQMQNDYAPR